MTSEAFGDYIENNIQYKDNRNLYRANGALQSCKHSIFNDM